VMLAGLLLYRQERGRHVQQVPTISAGIVSARQWAADRLTEDGYTFGVGHDVVWVINNDGQRGPLKWYVDDSVHHC
jgi:hypothetical protein